MNSSAVMVVFLVGMKDDGCDDRGNAQHDCGERDSGAHGSRIGERVNKFVGEFNALPKIPRASVNRIKFLLGIIKGNLDLLKVSLGLFDVVGKELSELDLGLLRYFGGGLLGFRRRGLCRFGFCVHSVVRITRRDPERKHQFQKNKKNFIKPF